MLDNFAPSRLCAVALKRPLIALLPSLLILGACAGGPGATEPPGAQEIAAGTPTAAAPAPAPTATVAIAPTVAPTQAAAPATPVPTPAPPQVATFNTEDGLTLSGTLFGGGKTVALLAHMRPTDQTSWQPFARKVADAGYAAFTFDFRGYGASGGAQQTGLRDRDVRAAIGYLRSGGFQSVVLIGASMGGSACAKNTREANVAGLAMISSSRGFEGVFVEEADLTAPIPKLFITSQDDEPAATDTRTMHAAAADPKQIEIFTGNAHGTFIFDTEHGAKLERLLLDFIRQTAGA